MSLINEALKKAQRQRSLDNAPLSSAPSGIAAAAVTTHVRAASHKRSHGALWFGIGLVALGATATVLIMRYGFDSADPQNPIALAPASAPAASAPAAGVKPPASTSTAPTPLETAPAVVVLPPLSQASTPAAPVVAPANPPVATESAAMPATVSPLPAVTSSPAPLPLPASAVAPTPVAPVAAPLTPAEQAAQVYSFLNTIRLAGVRGVDREARVLMNERVWRLNDIVSPELGLRLSSVRPNLLVFTDSQGRTYEKPY